MGDTARLRAEIAQTRARIEQIVEAIGHRMDLPGRVAGALSERADTVASPTHVPGVSRGERLAERNPEPDGNVAGRRLGSIDPH